MQNLLNAHPDLDAVITKDIKRYTYFDEHGNLKEMWERDENGHFIDVTEREHLKEELAKAQEELEKLRRQENGDSK